MKKGAQEDVMPETKNNVQAGAIRDTGNEVPNSIIPLGTSMVCFAVTFGCGTLLIGGMRILLISIVGAVLCFLATLYTLKSNTKKFSFVVAAIIIMGSAISSSWQAVTINRIHLQHLAGGNSPGNVIDTGGNDNSGNVIDTGGNQSARNINVGGTFGKNISTSKLQHLFSEIFPYAKATSQMDYFSLCLSIVMCVVAFLTLSYSVQLHGMATQDDETAPDARFGEGRCYLLMVIIFAVYLFYWTSRHFNETSPSLTFLAIIGSPREFAPPFILASIAPSIIALYKFIFVIPQVQSRQAGTLGTTRFAFGAWVGVILSLINLASNILGFYEFFSLPTR